MSVLGFTTPLLRISGNGHGAGAMAYHANDSYFWVVTNIGRMTPAQGYKTQTLGTLVAGIGQIIGILILSLILL